MIKIRAKVNEIENWKNQYNGTWNKEIIIWKGKQHI